MRRHSEMALFDITETVKAAKRHGVKHAKAILLNLCSCNRNGENGSISRCHLGVCHAMLVLSSVASLNGQQENGANSSKVELVSETSSNKTVKNICELGDGWSWTSRTFTHKFDQMIMYVSELLCYNNCMLTQTHQFYAKLDFVTVMDHAHTP